MMNYWSDDEVEILKYLWGSLYRKDVFAVTQIEEIFGRSIKGIDAKAYSLGLKKSDQIQQKIKSSLTEMLINRNKFILGRNITEEFARNEILKYKSKAELKKFDEPLYVWLNKSPLRDELSLHFIEDKQTSYPQKFLFYCIKELFPNHIVRYNDRTAIKPKELDVYIEELKIAFEYDGIVYHDKEQDEIKNLLCKNAGITLYRIMETNKRKPEEPILKCLSGFGFDVSKLDVQKLIEKSFHFCLYRHEEILEIVSKYTKLKHFRENEMLIYQHLRRKNLAKKYLSHMKTRDKNISEHDVICEIQKYSTKKSFRENSANKYQRMLKYNYLNAIELYNSLR